MRETALYELSRVEIGSAVFAVGDDKNKKRKGKERKGKEREGKGRKGTKSHKMVIFHVFVQRPPVNRF